jgi:hypothetical protein
MKEIEGALFNPGVAGPQCQEKKAELVLGLSVGLKIVMRALFKEYNLYECHYITVEIFLTYYLDW